MTTTNLGMTIPTIGGDLDIWGNELNAALALIDAFAGTLMGAAEVTIASAATVDIGSAASTAVAISGTTAITSLGAVANCIRFVRYAGAVPITHNATSLILIGAASRTVAAGDMSIFKSDAGGNWREVIFRKGDGSGVFTSLSTSGNATIGGQLSVTGASFLSGGLTLQGVTSALTVQGTGSSSIAGSLDVQSNLSCSNGDFHCGNSIDANGFNVRNLMSWVGMQTTPTGPPGGCNFTIVAHTNGVVLLDGGTSWGAVSLLERKTDLAPLPGSNPDHHAALLAARGDAPAIDDGLADCPFEIINNHRLVMGRYKNQPKGARRPFVIFEDAMAHFPQAAAHTDAYKAWDFERDDAGNVVWRQAVEDDGVTPKVEKDKAGNEKPVMERIPKEYEIPANDLVFYDHYIPLVMAALQKQHRINQDLTARLAALEGARV